MSTPKRLFEPASPVELLRGWLLHAHKGRDRHDEAARIYDSHLYLLGGFAIGLSALAGTAAFASLRETTGTIGHIAVGLVSIAASVLVALQTFLDYPGRAERHRIVAVKYKSVIRELEFALTGGTVEKDVSDPWFTDLRQRFNELEENAPVVAPRIYNRVEQRYANVTLVALALEMPPGAAQTGMPNPRPEGDCQAF